MGIFTHKNIHYRALLITVVVLCILIPTQLAFAQSSNDGYGIYGLIYSFLVGIGGLFTFLGGLLLDMSINALVTGMGSLMAGNIGFAVNQLWVVVRDIFNIIFIFSLIALGIQTILKSDDANTQRAIGYLIIAALLINFSLFITKTIVDFSNMTAYQIVQAMDTAGVGSGGTPVETTDGSWIEELYENNSYENGVSMAFLDRMRLSSYANDIQTTEDSNIGLRTVLFGFLMMMLMIVAGFVFAAGAFLLIARFVTLIFLMIFSPVLFLGWIYPSFKKYSTQYWQTFLKNAFVAPAYLFMLYLTLRIFAALGYGDQVGFGHFSRVLDNGALGTGVFVMVLFFVVIAGFLIGSVIVAQKIGAHGADTAMNITNRGRALATGIVRRPTQSLGGFAYRNTLGAAGAADAEATRRSLATLRDPNSTFGQRMKARAVIVPTAVRGGLNTAAGLRQLDAQANAAPLGGRSRADVKKDNEFLTTEANKAVGAMAQETNRKTIEKFMEANDDERKTMVDELVKAMSKLDATNLAKLDTKRLQATPQAALLISSKQLDGLKDADVAVATIDALKKAQGDAYEKVATDAAFAEQMTAGRTNAELLFAGKSKEDIGKMPKAVFEKAGDHLAASLTPFVLQSRIEMGALTEDGKKRMTEIINKEVGKGNKGYNKQWENWTEKNTIGNKFAFNGNPQNVSDLTSLGDPTA